MRFHTQNSSIYLVISGYSTKYMPNFGGDIISKTVAGFDKPDLACGKGFLGGNIRGIYRSYLLELSQTEQK